ncbi:hypothetical protein GUITHDRAFT_106792 [Guillardia theta CCMP2712]|uniref:Uncharacterized protein n=1 Tax=Guillardia theta (strain CCMP2712) TaxID=905079 RepID=L1JGT5_GUITC|nr:hypothetical protein GUITHDRAFT_106792 [Guillardia theta CCMP2712]EKX47344.1 hypothetical protein GUITHDRAFT_106792 [Guillardia theta CCMP2712]|eukprot:XP_005834324.1 hypothetical protein GUITHDRAFT_106792 [Guillardia theta CCMP2712]
MIAALTGAGPRYRKERRLAEARRAKHFLSAGHHNPSAHHNTRIDYMNSSEDTTVKGKSIAGAGQQHGMQGENSLDHFAPNHSNDAHDQVESQNPPAKGDSSPSSHIPTPNTVNASHRKSPAQHELVSAHFKVEPEDVPAEKLIEDRAPLRFFGPENKPVNPEDNANTLMEGDDNVDTPRVSTPHSLFSGCGGPCLACFFPKLGGKDPSVDSSALKPTVSADFWGKEKEKEEKEKEREVEMDTKKGHSVQQDKQNELKLAGDDTLRRGTSVPSKDSWKPSLDVDKVKEWLERHADDSMRPMQQDSLRSTGRRSRRLSALGNSSNREYNGNSPSKQITPGRYVITPRDSAADVSEISKAMIQSLGSAPFAKDWLRGHAMSDCEDERTDTNLHSDLLARNMVEKLRRSQRHVPYLKSWLRHRGLAGSKNPYDKETADPKNPELAQTAIELSNQVPVSQIIFNLASLFRLQPNSSDQADRSVVNQEP